MSPPLSPMELPSLELIEELTKNADKIQNNVLAEILSQNAETEYLQSFNFGGATDRKTFKSKIPMVTYEDLKPFIQRIADGDKSPILSSEPITGFVVSSGTSSGKLKLIPTFKEDWDRRQIANDLLMPVMNQYVKGLDKGKVLYFKFVRSPKKTASGLPAENGGTIFYKYYHSGTRPVDPYNDYTSPNEAILCVDFFQSMYAQMLCGLYEREKVLRVGTVFANGLIQAIKFLELNWQQLTHDIRTGLLNPKVNDAPILECMGRVMRPDPVLADFIAQECAKDNWEGIITRIWPNAKYLDTIVTGSMSQYIPSLDYFSAGLPIACTKYPASECFIGINLNPMCKPSQVSYTIMPNMAYFEFLPNEPNSNLLIDLVDVEIGKEYELVVTTYTGLYRYQVGDILRVTGFHNSAPQFQFVRRKNALLCIDLVRTDEVELQAAVKNASKLLKTIVVEYTSYADVARIPGHYIIYWELLSTNLPGKELLEHCCLVMEESLDFVYHVRRKENAIGALELRVVKNGTFEEVMKLAISNGASIAQYKVPRCVSSSAVIDLLNSRVVSSHFSPSFPQWTAGPAF